MRFLCGNLAVNKQKTSSSTKLEYDKIHGNAMLSLFLMNPSATTPLLFLQPETPFCIAQDDRWKGRWKHEICCVAESTYSPYFLTDGGTCVHHANRSFDLLPVD